MDEGAKQHRGAGEIATSLATSTASALSHHASMTMIPRPATSGSRIACTSLDQGARPSESPGCVGLALSRLQRPQAQEGRPELVLPSDPARPERRREFDPAHTYDKSLERRSKE